LESNRAFIFPFTFIPDGILERALSHFDVLILCLPHGLQIEKWMKPYVDARRIEIKRPGKELEPGDAFPYLLREYKAWMQTNWDKGYGGFLKYAKNRLREDESIFNIRGLIRGGLGGQVEYQDLPLKWHLIIHLAHQALKDLYEAKSLIGSAKAMDPLLKDAIFEEDSLESPLEDLRDMELEEYFGASKLIELMEAWLGLFKKELNKEDPLLTCNKDVVDLIIGDEPIQVEELSEDLICYTLPADKPIKVGALNHLSGLKLYLLEDL